MYVKITHLNCIKHQENLKLHDTTRKGVLRKLK